MIASKDIDALDQWARKGEAPDEVKAWHAQVLVELIDYIHYLERELSMARIKNADLDEKIRLGISDE